MDMSPTRTEQKERTREEILSSAVQRLREHGISGASVAEVMKGAGLTVGGFYAHFDSKDSLVSAGLRSCMSQMRDVMRSHLAPGKGAAAIAPLLRKYLSPAHRDQPQRGCPIPAVISEAAGAAEPVRETLRDEFEAHVKVLTEHLEGRPASRRSQALATLAIMYGGLAMARAVKGTPLSEEILEACREHGRAALER
jgi:TetR/AcrR family transcriptional regulator, transcriptional repressor for nem operon